MTPSTALVALIVLSAAGALAACSADNDPALTEPNPPAIARAMANWKIVQLPGVAGCPQIASAAFDINESNGSTGYVTNQCGSQQVTYATVWLPGASKATTLQAPPGSWAAVGRGINSKAAVAGYAHIGNTVEAVYWPKATASIYLGTLGGTFSRAFDLNDFATVVGVSDDPNGESFAFVWKPTTGMVPLPTLGGGSVALAVNNEGRIVGFSTDLGGYTHAVTWSGGTLEDLGYLRPGGQFEAHGLNEASEIVGRGQEFPAAPYPNSFYWRPGQPGKLIKVFGSLDVAWDINDRGQVVGQTATNPYFASPWHAYAVQPGFPATDIGTLPGDPNSFAYGISNCGEIAGESVSPNGVHHAVVWDTICRGP